MGTIISIDFSKPRRRGVKPAGQAAARTHCRAAPLPGNAAYALCLFAPLLLFWSLWLLPPAGLPDT
jgi:hypothetical protein